MSRATNAPVERLSHTASLWIDDVAYEFATEDHQFAFRVMRAWLHLVRDRLSVIEAAHFGAQLPELIRGVYYEGWQPAHVPIKYDHAEFVRRFASEAGIGDGDVPKAARLVSAAMDKRLGGSLSSVLEPLPAALRGSLMPWQEP